MDYTMIFIVLSILTWFYFLFIREKDGGVVGRLPPGPYPLPIIGSILKLGDKPHHSLAALSKTYGPLMSLKLGSTTTIVVSSHEIARELFSKHDIASSNRSTPYVTRAHDHYKFSLPWLPVGDQWRSLRRISKENVFSVRQLDASQLLRKEKVQQLVDYVHGCCVAGKPVNIGETISTTTLNLLSNFIFSIDLAEYDSLSSQNFKGLVWSVMEAVGTPNLADFFPILGPLDPHGLLRHTDLSFGKLMAIFDQHINKRLEATTECSSSKDLVDVLLDIRQIDKSAISLDEIRHLVFDLFIAGTDTTSSTLEWAMAELINNPEKMSKARSELEEVIGNEDRTVDESDISRLPYLQAIIKETLRLHPPVTFLLPRKAITNIEIQGYIIPKDAQILCNLWAMGQDPNVWSDPQTFRPERFLEVGVDYKGHDFELIPFGAGRRICPGLPLAHRMLHLMLGSLIYRFDWKIEEGEYEYVDMSDKFGLTLQKNLPLMAIPIKL